MELSSNLIEQFVKVTNDEEKSKNESIVYGETVLYNDSIYVKLDGSDRLTPISTTADVKAGERVTVMIKNHTATVTGNISSPAARTDDVKDLGNKISDFEIVIANKVDTIELAAEKARIDSLQADNATIKKTLTATNADIETLKTDNVTINEKLTANEADIESLTTNKLDVSIANATYATIENLDATNADIHNLEADYGNFKSLATDKFTAAEADISSLKTDKLDAATANATYATIENLNAANADIHDLEVDYGDFKNLTTNNFAANNASIEDLQANKLSATDADLKYANIDFTNIGSAAIKEFFSKSGMISDLVVGEGTITGKLVGVTIVGDLIEGGTVKADKLVIKGEDGLYYKLNTDGVTTEAEQTDYNSINGSIITANSITATKIRVDDLVAFDATIGGFNITEDSIYSGVKESVSNTTRGIYLDNDGQIAFGDDSNFVKFFQDTDGTYKLAISADSILFGSSKKSVETVINEIKGDLTSTPNVFVGDYIRTDTGEIVHSYVDDAGLTQYYCEVISVVDEVETTTLYQVTENEGVYTTTETVIETAPENSVTLETTPDVPYKIGDIWSTANNYTKICVSDSVDAFNDVDWADSTSESAEEAKDSATNAQDTADTAKQNADDAIIKVTMAESRIQQLADSIVTLVVDEDGGTTMTQTESGWTFNITDLQNAVGMNSDNVNSLNEVVNEANSAIGILQEVAAEYGVLSSYIRIGETDDGQPYIELGKSGGEGERANLKLRITNTEMQFLDALDKLAYFTNSALHVKTAIVEEELKHGGFVWKIRQNGNLGLQWIGDEE